MTPALFVGIGATPLIVKKSVLPVGINAAGITLMVNAEIVNVLLSRIKMSRPGRTYRKNRLRAANPLLFPFGIAEKVQRLCDADEMGIYPYFTSLTVPSNNNHVVDRVEVPHERDVRSCNDA